MSSILKLPITNAYAKGDYRATVHIFPYFVAFMINESKSESLPMNKDINA